MHKVHFSSNSNEWRTPVEFFQRLDAEFRFTLDAAATAENAQCANFYSCCALERPWPGTVWLNPPYGRGIKDWIAKAYREAQAGATVVVLMPVRSDTPYWHDYVMKAAEVRLVQGRLRFTGGPKENTDSHNAPFPCAVVVFRPGSHEPRFSSMPR